MSISASLVKTLRERTGAGMMECKKALTATNGDIELAIDEMRRSGQVKAAKKAGRIAAEGVVVTRCSENQPNGLLLEVNCETDFVSGGDEFKGFAKKVLAAAFEKSVADVETLMQTEVEGESLETTRLNLIAKIGENISVRRLAWQEGGDSIGEYVHNGRIGTLVSLKGGSAELAKQVAMHIAASNPLVISQSDVPAETIEKEKEIFKAQSLESGKPAEIVEKMVEGRIRKFLDEVALLGQPFVVDPSVRVGDLLKQSQASVLGFERFEVGEGIEKAEDDFAQEVMKTVQGS